MGHVVRFRETGITHEANKMKTEFNANMQQVRSRTCSVADFYVSIITKTSQLELFTIAF